MRKLMIPIVAAVAAVGCSSGATRTVSGQLDLTQMHPVNAQVVAISSAGRVFRAPISATGAFSIALPVNARYTVRFANATSVANRYDAFATLAPLRGGATTHWFSLTSGAAISLGNVARPGTTAKSSLSGLRTASDGADDGSSSADDAGEQEDDGAEACDLSSGQDDIDVESDHDLNDDVDSDHDGTPDSIDDHDDRGTCSAASDDDGCELSDNEAKELDDAADKPCTTGGGADGGTVPTPVPGVTP